MTYLEVLCRHGLDHGVAALPGRAAAGGDLHPRVGAGHGVPGPAAGRGSAHSRYSCKQIFAKGANP